MDYRQRIIEKAAEMFRTYGIRAVTMDMLANDLGISKRTIYEVFKDKDELLQGVLKWMAVKQREMMKEIMENSENIIEAVFKMLNRMRDHFRTMSPAFQMDMRRFHHDIIRELEVQDDLPYLRNHIEILQRGIREGIFREDINLEITNRCMHEVARISNDKNVFDPDAFPGEEVIRHFYINYLRGICTMKGLELVDFYEKTYK